MPELPISSKLLCTSQGKREILILALVLKSMRKKRFMRRWILRVVIEATGKRRCLLQICRQKQ
ncbi:hypothetical protein Tdes44962_MAKER03393 [Teratosphaeria destructans]|uniref:Uncharacterized protein n=1 Tax=Teratosphaeria destructans TaxID=418781 RepID=A0A9W7W1V2_9PEZI|nr:hypothetical protein Tdes44962_MAKER03393 [Teratosphaeria destructans]